MVQKLVLGLFSYRPEHCLGCFTRFTYDSKKWKLQFHRPLGSYMMNPWLITGTHVFKSLSETIIPHGNLRFLSFCYLMYQAKISMVSLTEIQAASSTPLTWRTPTASAVFSPAAASTASSIAASTFGRATPLTRRSVPTTAKSSSIT